MKKYTVESLKEINEVYDRQHGVTEIDVDRVNQAIEIIENSRKKTPQVGDVVEYTNQYGDYYAHAHIETVEKELYICERAYEPFVFFNPEDKTFCTSTSGGTWAHIPKKLKLVGVKEKAFVGWGHNGACGNGAVRFYAQVNVWEYTEGVHRFTTQTHDRFHVSILEKPDEYGYRYIITRSGESCSAFRTKKEYDAWLKTYRGVEVDGNWVNTKMVWTFKQLSKCVPLEVYQSITGAIVDSEYEGSIQECKRIYEGTTVTTVLPHQHERIELSKGTKAYMRAYEV